MSRLLMACVLVLAVAHPASAFHDQIDAFVDSLNTSEARNEWGLDSAFRPQDIANRIDVVFREEVSPELRARALQEIGRRFLRILSDRTGIMTASIVERNPDGTIRDRATVSMLGSPGVALPASP